MHDLSSLVTLLEHAQRERDAVRARHLQIQEQVQAAQARMQQLQAYRAQQVQRWRGQFKRGRSIQAVQHYQSFLQRLDTALEQQQGACAHLQAQLDLAQQALLAAERRVASTERLMAQRQAAAQAVAQRREQKQTDELAMRMAWSARLGDTPSPS
jgi:flagellar protein FliJ